jgi:prepilin-type N-terminal cleavage/methylation domain-containing protein/prepilin-type processing-associated H-X9-DG protein
MKKPLTRNKARGLTLLEVLIVIAVLMLAAALYLTTLANRNVRNPRIACVNNLKQVGLAFRVWEEDHNDKYPMSVSMTNGGTMEPVESGVVWRHFQVMSNELNTPKILFCPQDTDSKRNMASTFGGSLIPGLIPFTGNSNTSYFLGVDATDINPTLFLAGDRNLSVKGAALSPGLHSLGTNELMGWTRELHVNQGNVLMADGSVQSLSQSALQAAWEKTGTAKNRLAVP